ncbi:MAG: hypothetical protein JWL96_351 [Sphingomonas bacterium]|uniref:hypothetical protein n=1 Tax=Sphingomonas bacterium TaxID=1895847 RepID=UPI00261D0BE0|nr:hypothetical protein [Sphingomonas bacterium]MDB5708281.1 hypothetical protein [Sphingomonas bacterium]
MTSRLHRDGRIWFVTLSTTALAAAGLAGCKPASPAGNAIATATPLASPCGQLAPTQTSALPSNPGNNQAEVDCSAWSAFIALNWRADPAKPGFPDPAADWASFGTPGDNGPKVWESYLEASNVFGGKAPLKGMWQAKRPGVKSLVRLSKLNNIDLSAIDQAGSGDHWLTNQRGDVTYYEVMMNQDEFEFITQANFDLTTAAGQLACAQQPGKPVSDSFPPLKPPYPPGTVLRGGINFPAGNGAGWDDTDCTGSTHSFGQHVGAMEVKAAWTPLPADGSLNYRYKTAQAEILDPTTKKVRTVTVGLTGLHIIRKRFPRLPWVWATFEQIDNSPDEAAGGGFTPPALPANPNQKPSPGFTFFNPTCNPGNDKVYACKHNAPPTPCGPAGTPCDPYTAPMQITRINPVGATANSVTAYVWNMLPPKSVFNYYRLVDVQWPTAGIAKPVPGPGLKTPLTMGTPTPQGAAGGPTQIVANTTLESFQQTSNACMDCHVYAPIASPQLLAATGPHGLRMVAKPAAGAAAPYAADYSFLFVSETKR